MAVDARDVVERNVRAFTALYPNCQFDVEVAGSRRAIASLLAAESDLAVLSRELEPEERSVTVSGGLEMEGYRFARDAIVVVTHPSNPVENVAIDELRAIYEGRLRNWSRLGGKDLAVEPVVQPLSSDLTTSFHQLVMAGAPMTAPAHTEGSDSAVVARVTRTPGAVGFVSLPWADRGAHAVKLAAVTGLPYFAPDPEDVYRGQYPLTRYFNLYVRGRGRKLANGFVTFVTSRDGQALVHDAGLVPTSVPVRFVRRSPMLGTH